MTEDQTSKILTVLKHLEPLSLGSLELGFTVAAIISHGKTFICIHEEELSDDVIKDGTDALYSFMEHHGQIFFTTPDESD
jgi:hypothetical protein